MTGRCERYQSVLGCLQYDFRGGYGTGGRALRLCGTRNVSFAFPVLGMVVGSLFSGGIGTTSRYRHFVAVKSPRHFFPRMTLTLLCLYALPHLLSHHCRWSKPEPACCRVCTNCRPYRASRNLHHTAGVPSQTRGGVARDGYRRSLFGIFLGRL